MPQYQKSRDSHNNNGSVYVENQDALCDHKTDDHNSSKSKDVVSDSEQQKHTHSNGVSSQSETLRQQKSNISPRPATPYVQKERVSRAPMSTLSRTEEHAQDKEHYISPSHTRPDFSSPFPYGIPAAHGAGACQPTMTSQSVNNPTYVSHAQNDSDTAPALPDRDYIKGSIDSKKPALSISEHSSEHINTEPLPARDYSEEVEKSKNARTLIYVHTSERDAENNASTSQQKLHAQTVDNDRLTPKPPLGRPVNSQATSLSKGRVKALSAAYEHMGTSNTASSLPSSDKVSDSEAPSRRQSVYKKLQELADHEYSKGNKEYTDDISAPKGASTILVSKSASVISTPTGVSVVTASQDNKSISVSHENSGQSVSQSADTTNTQTNTSTIDAHKDTTVVNTHKDTDTKDTHKDTDAKDTHKDTDAKDTHKDTDTKDTHKDTGTTSTPTRKKTSDSRHKKRKHKRRDSAKTIVYDVPVTIVTAPASVSAPVVRVRPESESERFKRQLLSDNTFGRGVYVSAVPTDDKTTKEYFDAACDLREENENAKFVRQLLADNTFGNGAYLSAEKTHSDEEIRTLAKLKRAAKEYKAEQRAQQKAHAEERFKRALLADTTIGSTWGSGARVSTGLYNSAAAQKLAEFAAAGAADWEARKPPQTEPKKPPKQPFSKLLKQQSECSEFVPVQMQPEAILQEDFDAYNRAHSEEMQRFKRALLTDRTFGPITQFARPVSQPTQPHRVQSARTSRDAMPKRTHKSSRATSAKRTKRNAQNSTSSKTHTQNASSSSNSDSQSKLHDKEKLSHTIGNKHTENTTTMHGDNIEKHEQTTHTAPKTTQLHDHEQESQRSDDSGFESGGNNHSAQAKSVFVPKGYDHHFQKLYETHDVQYDKQGNIIQRDQSNVAGGIPRPRQLKSILKKNEHNCHDEVMWIRQKDEHGAYPARVSEADPHYTLFNSDTLSIRDNRRDKPKVDSGAQRLKDLKITQIGEGVVKRSLVRVDEPISSNLSQDPNTVLDVNIDRVAMNKKTKIAKEIEEILGMPLKDYDGVRQGQRFGGRFASSKPRVRIAAYADVKYVEGLGDPQDTQETQQDNKSQSKKDKYKHKDSVKKVTKKDTDDDAYARTPSCYYEAQMVAIDHALEIETKKLHRLKKLYTRVQNEDYQGEVLLQHEIMKDIQAQIDFLNKEIEILEDRRATYANELQHTYEHKYLAVESPTPNKKQKSLYRQIKEKLPNMLKDVCTRKSQDTESRDKGVITPFKPVKLVIIDFNFTQTSECEVLRDILREAAAIRDEELYQQRYNDKRNIPDLVKGDTVVIMLYPETNDSDNYHLDYQVLVGAGACDFGIHFNYRKLKKEKKCNTPRYVKTLGKDIKEKYKATNEAVKAILKGAKGILNISELHVIGDDITSMSAANAFKEVVNKKKTREALLSSCTKFVNVYANRDYANYDINDQPMHVKTFNKKSADKAFDIDHADHHEQMKYMDYMKDIWNISAELIHEHTKGYDSKRKSGALNCSECDVLY